MFPLNSGKLAGNDDNSNSGLLAYQLSHRTTVLASHATARNSNFAAWVALGRVPRSLALSFVEEGGGLKVRAVQIRFALCQLRTSQAAEKWKGTGFSPSITVAKHQALAAEGSFLVRKPTLSG
jgi:hypothetical protein